MDLNGKRAIVLGGTSGIGLAVSKQLVAAGARVTAASRTANRAVAEGVTVRPVDVLNRTALEQLFKALAPFDVLVNAATGGGRAIGPFLQMDLDGFEGSFRKLWGYVNSVRLGAPLMSERGSIVLISGSPARKAMPGMAAISTVGNAVEGFVRAIAPELAPRRINVVAPGVIDTPMFAAQRRAARRIPAAGDRAQRHPARRHGRRSGRRGDVPVAQRIHDRHDDRRRRWRAVAVSASEAFGAGLANVVGEVPVQRRNEIGHLRIHREVKTLDRVRAPRDAAERFIELREVGELELHVELAQRGVTESELAPRQPITLEYAIFFEDAEIGLHRVGEFEIVDAFAQITPDVVDVHVTRSPSPNSAMHTRAMPSR